MKELRNIYYTVLSLLHAIWEYVAANPIEVFAAVTGILSIWLNTRQSKWGWVWGMVSIVPYGYVFFVNRLYQDFILHLFYLSMSVYGFWSWTFQRTKSGNVLPVSRSQPPELLLLSVMGVLGVGISGWLFATYTDADLPYWDAFTTVFSFIGTWMLARKRLENWLLWLIVNTCAIGIYFYKELYVTSVLYGIYWGLAVVGWQRWRRELS